MKDKKISFYRHSFLTDHVIDVIVVLQQAAHIWRGTHDHFGTKVLLHNLKEYVFWSRKMVDDILGNLYKKFYRRLKLDISSAWSLKWR